MIGLGAGLAIEGVRQALDGEFNGMRLIAAGVGGTVTGALTAATFGAGGVASAGSIGLSQLGAGGVIGVTGGSSQSFVAGDDYTLAQGGIDFMVGAVTLGFGGALEKTFRPHAGAITRAADDFVKNGETAIADPAGTVEKIRSATNTQTAQSVPKAASTAAVEPAQYGPFHRLTVDPNELELVRQSGELGGRAMRNNNAGLFPYAKAYEGPLPDGESGYDFYTPIKPRKASPHMRIWDESMPGVRKGEIQGDDAVFIPIKIAKERQ